MRVERLFIPPLLPYGVGTSYKQLIKLRTRVLFFSRQVLFEPLVPPLQGFFFWCGRTVLDITICFVRISSL